MHASEFLNAAKRDAHIIRLMLVDTNRDDANVGQGDAYVVDPDNRIAILLSDVGSSQRTNLKAGDFVQFSAHPEAQVQRIVSADSIRPDARPGHRPLGDPYLTPADPS